MLKGLTSDLKRHAWGTACFARTASCFARTASCTCGSASAEGKQDYEHPLHGLKSTYLGHRPHPGDRGYLSATRLKFARVSSIASKVLGITVSTIPCRCVGSIALTVLSPDRVSSHDSSTSVPPPTAVKV